MEDKKSATVAVTTGSSRYFCQKFRNHEEGHPDTWTLLVGSELQGDGFRGINRNQPYREMTFAAEADCNIIFWCMTCVTSQDMPLLYKAFDLLAEHYHREWRRTVEAAVRGTEPAFTPTPKESRDLARFGVLFRRALALKDGLGYNVENKPEASENG